MKMNVLRAHLYDDRWKQKWLNWSENHSAHIGKIVEVMMITFFIFSKKFSSILFFIWHEEGLLRCWPSTIHIIQFVAHTLFQFVQKPFTIKVRKGPTSRTGELNTRTISHTWTLHHFVDIHCWNSTKCIKYDKSFAWIFKVGLLRGAVPSYFCLCWDYKHWQDLYLDKKFFQWLYFENPNLKQAFW